MCSVSIITDLKEHFCCSKNSSVLPCLSPRLWHPASPPKAYGPVISILKNVQVSVWALECLTQSGPNSSPFSFYKLGSLGGLVCGLRDDVFKQASQWMFHFPSLVRNGTGHYMGRGFCLHPLANAALTLRLSDCQRLVQPDSGRGITSSWLCLTPLNSPSTLHEPEVSSSPQTSTSISSSTVALSTPPFWSRRRAVTWTSSKITTSWFTSSASWAACPCCLGTSSLPCSWIEWEGSRWSVSWQGGHLCSSGGQGGDLQCSVGFFSSLKRSGTGNCTGKMESAGAESRRHVDQLPGPRGEGLRPPSWFRPAVRLHFPAEQVCDSHLLY